MKHFLRSSFRWLPWLLLFGTGCFLFFSVRAAVESARATACRGYMGQLQSALTLYAHANGHLPPAYIEGPDGKPWHSWRVLILPYLSEHSVYEKYDFGEPWNGPNNRMLADQIRVDLFQCPSGYNIDSTLNTDYVVVVGDETAFPGSESVALSDIKDGPENTILLVEIADSDIHWMEPRDLSLDALSVQKDGELPDALCNHHPDGPGVVFADKITTYRLQSPMSIEELKSLLTISGSESIRWDSFRGSIHNPGLPERPSQETGGHSAPSPPQ